MKKYNHKIVIIGTWAAGLRCAIQLREEGEKDILLVGDRAFADAHTTQARGWINAALHTMDKEDTPLVHAVDTYREWQELSHPDLVEHLSDEAPAAIDDLLRWGADFHKEDDGRLTQRFFGAHSYRRTVFSGDQTGKEMIRVMSARAKELWIPYLEHTYVADLIVEAWSIKWVMAVDEKTDELMTITASAVVLATWWFTNVYWRSSSRSKENFGDGIALALKAWVMIWDIELIQFHPTGLLYPDEKYGELVTEAMRGEWAKLINTQWEQFMINYDPIKLELSTRDVVARANFQEIQEGRGTPRWGVFLDISHRSKEYILERLPKMHSMILEWNDVDISEEPVEVWPTTHYTMGGIHFDAKTMETNISWLYAAGECTMGVHGANRLWGNSLMETMVYGKAVANALLKMNSQGGLQKNIWWEQMEEEIDIVISDKWLDANSVMEDIRKRMWELAGIIRKKDELLVLKSELEQNREQFLAQWIADQWSLYDNIMMYRRLRAVIHLGLLICTWALERKESRGAHFRSDYTEIDASYDKNYLHQLVEGRIQSSWSDVPQASDRLKKWLEEFERTKNYGHSE